MTMLCNKSGTIYDLQRLQGAPTRAFLLFALLLARVGHIYSAFTWTPCGVGLGVKYAGGGVWWRMEVLLEEAEDFPPGASGMLKSTSESESLSCRSLSLS